MFSRKILVMTLGLATAAGASCAGAAEILSDGFESAALGRRYAFTVYLPEGDHEAAERRFPVLYLLHGANGDENEWLAKGNVRAVFDALIAQKKIEPMVVVMPGSFGTWWVDGAKEKAETALLKEAIPMVEARYRVRTDREGRLMAGSSAGGYAVARYVLKYPDHFAAAAALSPAVYVDEPPETSSARRQHPLTDATGKYSKQVWRELNYPNLIANYEKQSLRVPLYINSGDHDRHGIAPEAASLYVRMLKVQPGQTELRIVDGDHEWPVWASTIGDAVRYMARFIKTTAIQADSQSSIASMQR